MPNNSRCGPRISSDVRNASRTSIIGAWYFIQLFVLEVSKYTFGHISANHQRLTEITSTEVWNHKIQARKAQSHGMKVNGIREPQIELRGKANLRPNTYTQNSAMNEDRLALGDRKSIPAPQLRTRPEWNIGA